MERRIARSLDAAARAFAEATGGEAAKQVADIANVVLDCFQSGGIVYTCGNGGSLAEAMHFAEECSGRYKLDRPPLPAVALADPTHFTCAANDYGFESIFERSIRALGHPGDVLVVLSTSGKSENVVLAAKTANTIGMRVVGLLGGDGGTVAKYCQKAFIPKAIGSARIQELHLWAIHSIIDAVETAIFEPEDL